MMSYASLSSCSQLMLAYLQAAANRCSRSSTERRRLFDYDVFAAAFACTYSSLLLLFYLCSLSTLLLFASALLRFLHFALAHLFATCFTLAQQLLFYIFFYLRSLRSLSLAPALGLYIQLIPLS